MKPNKLDQNGEREHGRFRKTCHACVQAVSNAVAGAKDKLLAEYGEFVGEHARVLRLAVNEAEALAWDTEFPHLFFPALAAEKAETALAWHRRQRAVRRASGEFAFPA